MRILFFTTVILLFFSSTSNAKTHCLFVVGDGSFFKPQVPPRYINGIKNIDQSWGQNCAKKTYLISMGKNSMIYNERKNTYQKIEGIPIDGAASTKNIIHALKKSISELEEGDEIKAYFHDHGSRTGFKTVDGVLQPDLLEKIVMDMTQKKIKFKSIFNHCFSGKMNAAVYDNASVGGCSISSANNNPSFSVNEMSGNKNQKTFTQVVSKNHENISNGDYINILMRSSDRFLLDYGTTPISAFTPYIVGDDTFKCNINSIAGYLPFEDEYHALARVGLNAYYQNLYYNLKRMELLYEKHLNQEKKQRNLTKNKKLSQGYVVQCAQELYAYMNQLLELKQLEPENVATFSRRDELYSKLGKCQKIQNDNKVCEGYEEYLNITRKIENMRVKLHKEVLLKNTPVDINCFRPDPTKLWSVKNALDELNSMSSSITRIENIIDKRNHYIEMSNSLMAMIKNNDHKALDTLKGLLLCEEETIF
ncbi:MAG: hypothetical protein JNM93_11815 [Bacteriovoracaceae bacterium]|nr:hypothetical protein [Bacteriovoracaceae bacterium]